MSSLIRTSLRKYPIITNSLIYGSLCIAAEFSQQTLNKKVLADKTEEYDKPVLLRYTVYGYGLAGPAISFWYRFLDKKFVGATTKMVIKKLLIDQFVFTPQLLFVFFVSMSIMEGKSDIFEEFRNKIVSTFSKSCMFWLPAQCINFALISPLYRVTYTGCCSFAWINILVWVKRQTLDENK